MLWLAVETYENGRDRGLGGGCLYLLGAQWAKRRGDHTAGGAIEDVCSAGRAAIPRRTRRACLPNQDRRGRRSRGRQQPRGAGSGCPCCEAAACARRGGRDREGPGALRGQLLQPLWPGALAGTSPVAGASPGPSTCLRTQVRSGARATVARASWLVSQERT